ncbi:MAG: glycoside hydrolase family 9 protein, partial [Planctomycetota bacterium]
REPPKRADRKDPHAVRDSRNLAAAELFRLTGEARWHDIFIATSFLKGADPVLYKWRSHDQRDAAWVYLWTERAGMDAGIRRNCRAALLKEADERVRGCGRTAFRWTKDPWRPLSWGALTAPDAIGLARAHAVSGDARFLRAAVMACQFGAGANPSNLCYTTGLGHESPKHPLHIDSRVTDQPPPPGLTVFGPIDLEREKKRKYWILERYASFWHPSPYSWPTLEAYWDVFWYPAMCEFTVHSTMATTAYVWGYLAARR